MSALVVYANTREAKESLDPADEDTGPRLAKLGGACCKEVGSTPQILATLPLSYRNTDGAALSFTSRPQRAQRRQGAAARGLRASGRGRANLQPSLGEYSRHSKWLHPSGLETDQGVHAAFPHVDTDVVDNLHALRLCPLEHF